MDQKKLSSGHDDEPLWYDFETGETLPVKDLTDRYIQKAERWLRGGSTKHCSNAIKIMWQERMRAELDRRGLGLLPDELGCVDASDKAYTYAQAYGGKTAQQGVDDILRNSGCPVTVGTATYDAELTINKLREAMWKSGLLHPDMR